MARITAQSLKAIVQKSEVSQKTNAKIEQARKREEQKLWKLLLKEAIEGCKEICLQNLDASDLRFLSEIGLAVEEEFTRNQAQSVLIEEMAALESEAGDWDAGFDKNSTPAKNDKRKSDSRDFGYIGDWNTIERGQYTVSDDEDDDDDDTRVISTEDERKFLDWLITNQNIAYECDLERWFGEELIYVQIFNPECLDDLIKKIESILIRSKNSAQLKAIKKLGTIAISARNNYKKYIQNDRLAAEKRQDAIDRIKELRNDPDYQWEDEVLSIHCISWDIIETTKIHDSFDVRILEWAANTGQQFFQKIEEIIVRLAENGERSADLTCSTIGYSAGFHYDRKHAIDDLYYTIGNTQIRWPAPESSVVADLLKLNDYKVKLAKSDPQLSKLTINWE
jgi:hypothetical protein